MDDAGHAFLYERCEGFAESTVFRAEWTELPDRLQPIQRCQFMVKLVRLAQPIQREAAEWTGFEPNGRDWSRMDGI